MNPEVETLTKEARKALDRFVPIGIGREPILAALDRLDVLEKRENR